MHSDRYQRACDLFLRACELPRDEQAALLADDCQDDEALRRQVENMLAEDQSEGLVAPAAVIGELLESAPAACPDTLSGCTNGHADFPPATRLPEIDGFTLIERIGKGGMGIVYRAIQHSTQRVVALKAVRFSKYAPDECLRRFMQEIRLAASLEHPNIARIYEGGQAGEVPWLAMEFIDGLDLGALIRLHPLTVRDKLQLMATVCDAVSFAHRRGIIHRDLKPGNILVTRNLQPFVVDFGLARLLEIDHHPNAMLSVNGELLGTPGFMSPEQARGESAATDVRSDSYSLGSILFWILTGHTPHDLTGSLLTVMRRIAEQNGRSARLLNQSLDDRLVAMLSRAIALKPEDRYQTVDELAVDLRRYLNDQPHVSAGQTIGTTGFKPPAQPRRRWYAAGGALTLAVLLVAAMIVQPKWSNFEQLDINSHASQDEQSELITGRTSVHSGNAQKPWIGWPADAPLPAIAPFDESAATQYQKAWALHLGVPVDYVNSIGMKFRLIPPGEFAMGSTPSEIESAVQELAFDPVLVEGAQSASPQHRVILTQPFYMSLYEVTQAEYQQVMGTNPSDFSINGSANKFVVGKETGRFPVESVSWTEATEFCEALNRLEQLQPIVVSDNGHNEQHVGTAYRLPTEAEWEFACRAGTTTRFWFGDNDEDLAKAGWGGFGVPNSVGELRANAFGLYDTLGNVQEWVQDSWDASFYSKFGDAPAVNPMGAETGLPTRILRGGHCLAQTPAACRSSGRYATPPTNRNGTIGFRVTLMTTGRPLDRPYR